MAPVEQAVECVEHCLGGVSCARLRPDLIHDDFRSDNPRVSFDFGDSFLRMVNLPEIHLLILSMQAIVVVLVDGKVSVHRLA